MTKEFDLLVFICRAQPLHKGHEYVIRKALESAERVLILVGSANRARSTRNPFTFSERSVMITDAFHTESTNPNTRLMVRSLNDYDYNDTAWIAEVQRIVKGAQEEIQKTLGGSTSKVGLVGYAKDHTSYYLKMFPDWGSLNVDTQFSTFNSTDIRGSFFRKMPILPMGVCSKSVVDKLEEFMYTEEFKWLVKESVYIKDYKDSWKLAPFPPVFVTVDNVVIQSGHILLIERGPEVGGGLLALPGGFLDTKQSLIESAIRELKEETNISDSRDRIPPGRLKSFITKSMVFDAPDRSTRGRTITHAYLYELPNQQDLYKVTGGDDAAKADWCKIGTIPADKFFEDHYFIMCKMLGLTI